MLKKFIWCSCIFISVVLPRAVQSENAVEVYYFFDDACYACQSMTDAITSLDSKYETLSVQSINAGADERRQVIFSDFMELYQVYNYSVPTIIVGNDVYSGYSTSIVSGIEQSILYCLNNSCPSPRLLLKDYYNSLDQAEQSGSPNSILFWSIFLFLWPLLGIAGIVYVLKKYKPKKRIL